MSDFPSVGRIVHFVSHGSPVRADGTQAYASQCRAAIITAVHNGDEVFPDSGVPLVDLCILNPEGMLFKLRVSYEPRQDGYGMEPAGTWHWPERV